MVYVPYDFSRVRVLDLSQNFSIDSPAFAYYEGPTVKWVKRLAFEGVNAQLISTTNHIATPLDSPIHFYDPGPTRRHPARDSGGAGLHRRLSISSSRLQLRALSLRGWERARHHHRRVDSLSSTPLTLLPRDCTVPSREADLPRPSVRHPGPRRVRRLGARRGIRGLAYDALPRPPVHTNVPGRGRT